MRACFLGQNVCALGFGVATLQTPPLMAEPEGAKPYVPRAIIPDVTPIHPADDISTGFVSSVSPPGRALGPVAPGHWPDLEEVFRRRD